jgi:hypothetical protein
MSYYSNASSKNVLNELFDLQASLVLQIDNMSIEGDDAALKDIANEVEKKFGRRPSLSTLSRLQTGQVVRPIYGLRETELAWTKMPSVPNLTFG